MKLKDLAVNHPYYCSDNNYYSREPENEWDTMTEFLDEFEDADIDMNLVFRWDIHAPDEGEKEYHGEIFIMHQRKGIFAPHRIKLVTENEVDRLVAFLQKHFDRLNEIWSPLRKGN